ncbi:hypothetical protein INP77_12575 [Methylophilus sp. 13]|uniref:hypothetical protein n=1 Tax=Methylophilus sp. 13 TaxID=2781018 RepID=UPI00188E0BBF|nr:hypothetical protein [Methylophilus sp. 13]MBF5040327.1 hypothetical protein [Methylophilus sp. 13]
MKYQRGLLFGLIMCLSSCTTIRNSNVEDIRVDGLPLGKVEDVARIQIQTYKKDPRNPLYPWWSATIIAFDGIDLPKNHKASVIQTTPGKHKVGIAYSIEAEFNPTGKRVRSTCQFDDMELKVGKLIFINSLSINLLQHCSIKYGEDDPFTAYQRK